MIVTPEMFEKFCEESCPYKENRSYGHGWMKMEPCLNCPIDSFHGFVDDQPENRE